MVVHEAAAPWARPVSSRELLAEIVGDKAACLALRGEECLRDLSHKSAGELAAKGLPGGKAKKILAALELGVRAMTERPCRPAVSSSSEVADLMRHLETEQAEVFVALLLNVKDREHTTRDKSNDRRWRKFTCEEWTLPTKRVSDLLCSEHSSALHMALFLAHVCNLSWQFNGVSGKPWERFTGESYAGMAESLEKAADILLRTLQAIDDIKRARVALDNAAKRLEHKEA